MDLLDLYDRGSQWAATKIPGAATQLDRPTACPDWTVRDLLNHVIDTQRYFAAAGRGEDAPLPNPTPPEVLGDDPEAAYETVRQEMLTVYRQPGVIEKTGPSLGLAFTDQLIHGSDLAAATGQDPTIPEDLASAGFAMIDGQLTDERRGDAFAPEVEVPAGATAHQRLLAYSGRQP